VSFIDGENRDQVSLLPACIDDDVAIDINDPKNQRSDLFILALTGA